MPRQVQVTVLSWNCLADCYAHGTSASKSKNVNKFLPWTIRSERIFRVIKHEDADIVCLQEVDHFTDSYEPFFRSLRYHTVYLNRPGREDGVLIAFKVTKFDLLRQDMVQFDDLATVDTPFLSISQRARLKKQNVAIILLLRTRSNIPWPSTPASHTFTVSTTHLYWNPMSPQIKLAQAMYLLERITDVREERGVPPTAAILTGDFNSLPQSQAYECILSGMPFPAMPLNSNRSAAEKACAVLSTHLKHGNVVRFICDAQLGRLARWLRLLGVDTAIEDRNSQDRRSKQNDFTALFDKARSEHRIIVTTSTGMTRRAACPETYLVRTAKRGGLETCLAKLLNFYNVKLKRSDFLSICGKCGGDIEMCSTNDLRLEGKDAPSDRQLFLCVDCYQVYWWSDSTNGSSARARRLAESLFAVVQADRDSQSQFRTATKNGYGNEDLCPEGEKVFTVTGKMERTNMAESVPLRHERNQERSWLKYMSAFTIANGQEPAYTNINGSFRGTLDYIFVGGFCEVTSTDMRESVNVDDTGKKSFPNLNWPSDHMLLRAEVILTKNSSARLPFSRTMSSPIMYTNCAAAT